MKEVERGAAIRRIRRGGINSLVVDAFVVVAIALCSAFAAHNGWWALSALLAAAVSGFFLWLDCRVIHLDQDGQPLTGRDADRLARLRWRAYQMHDRAHSGGRP
jgi:hypothetical protein